MPGGRHRWPRRGRSGILSRVPEEDASAEPGARDGASAAPGAAPSARPLSAPWWVYVLRSGDRARTYVGSTTDPERRLAQHNGREPGGARSTRAGRPWRIGALHGPFEGRAEALRLEARLKRRRGAARLSPVGSGEEAEGGSPPGA